MSDMEVGQLRRTWNQEVAGAGRKFLVKRESTVYGGYYTIVWEDGTPQEVSASWLYVYSVLVDDSEDP